MQWHHLKCEDLDEEDWKILSLGKKNIKWYCNNCEGRVNEIVKEDRESDYVDIRRSQREMRKQMEKLMEQMSDMEQKIKDLEKKPIGDELKNTLGLEGENGIKERLRKVEEDTKTKCNAEQVNGIMKHEMTKETDKLKSTLRKTVVEEASKSREKNVIIFRAQESNSNLKDEISKHDKELAEKLIRHCKGEINDNTIEKLVRLGRKEPGKTRPLLIAFKDLESKKDLFRNVSELGKETTPEELKSLALEHDMTIKEREEKKKLVEEAKRLNQENPEYRHIVKGAPWNREIVAYNRN